MPKSTTRFVKTKKIADSGIASVLARLMMIVNDMAIVNESLRVWSTSKDKRWESRKGGGRALFGRVQMSYVYEALEVIKEIRDSAALMAEVRKCNKKTQDCFAAVTAFLDTDDYKKLIQLRNTPELETGNFYAAIYTTNRDRPYLIHIPKKLPKAGVARAE
jgi:hypothetical protein